MFTGIQSSCFNICFSVHRYTKLGFAGNNEPQMIMPSAVAIKETASVGDRAARRVCKGVEDLDFFIGDEAMNATGYAVKVRLLLLFFSNFKTIFFAKLSETYPELIVQKNIWYKKTILLKWVATCSVKLNGSLIRWVVAFYLQTSHFTRNIWESIITLQGLFCQNEGFYRAMLSKWGFL